MAPCSSATRCQQAAGAYHAHLSIRKHVQGRPVVSRIHRQSAVVNVGVDGRMIQRGVAASAPIRQVTAFFVGNLQWQPRGFRVLYDGVLSQ